MKTVFISSTVHDLIDVRAELEALIREIGLMPRLSESTSSEFERIPANSIEVCLSNVRSSDVVLLVLSNRYGPRLGSSGFDNVSATHLEYKEAVKNGKTIFFYVRDKLVGDYSIWNKNKKRGLGAEEEIEYVWVSNKNDRGLFEFLDEHRQLKPAAQNWYTEFKNSIELKQTVRKDLKNYVIQNRLSDFLAGGDVSRSLRDSLEGVWSKRSGLSVTVSNKDELDTWSGQLIYNLRKLFMDRQSDVEVTWLRPSAPPSSNDNVKRKLSLTKRDSAKSKTEHHYEFFEGEGFAGRVWKEHKAAWSSGSTQHEWWQLRQGCENATYLCAPVGDFEGTGGVLAVGSDFGFETSNLDLEVVKLFADVLAIGCSGSEMPVEGSVKHTQRKVSGLPLKK